MGKSSSWYYSYCNVCGKIQPKPTTPNIFDTSSSSTYVVARSEQPNEKPLSFEIKNPGYPTPGAFAFVGIFFGVRLETLLLNQTYNTKSFRQIVGLKNENEAKSLDSQATFVRLYNAKTLFGYLQELSFDLVPVDPKKTVKPLGTRYHTGTIFNTSIKSEVLRNDLINFQFKFGGKKNVKYLIDEKTIKFLISQKESSDYIGFYLS